MYFIEKNHNRLHGNGSLQARMTFVYAFHFITYLHMTILMVTHPLSGTGQGMASSTSMHVSM